MSDLQFPHAQLRRILAAAQRCASTDNSRPSLADVVAIYDGGEDGQVFVATDSYRLLTVWIQSIETAPRHVVQEWPLTLLPISPVLDWLTPLSSRFGRERIEVQVSIERREEDKSLRLTLGDEDSFSSLTLRAVQGDYPRWASLVSERDIEQPRDLPVRIGLSPRYMNDMVQIGDILRDGRFNDPVEVEIFPGDVVGPVLFRYRNLPVAASYLLMPMRV
jgi:hypothetical protein